MDLPSTGEGGTFYEFPAIPEGAKAFKKWYRAELDGLNLPTGTAEMCVCVSVAATPL